MEDPFGEEFMVLLYDTVVELEPGTVNFFITALVVDTTDSVLVFTSAHDLETWEDEYPYPGPLACELDFSAQFFRVQGMPVWLPWMIRMIEVKDWDIRDIWDLELHIVYWEDVVPFDLFQVVVLNGFLIRGEWLNCWHQIMTLKDKIGK